MLRGWVPVLAIAVCAQTAQAQSAPAAPAAQDGAGAPAPTLSDAFGHARKNEIMPALAVLEQVVAANPSSRGTAAQYWAFSGDLATADALFAPASPPASSPSAAPTPAVPLPDLSQLRPEPAIEAIVRAARGQRVVMINEAHHSPQHRAFIHKLVLALRAEGFTHLAAETFCNGCPELIEDGAPMIATGFYTLDPVFADLVRQAAAAGYGLVAYEWRSDQMVPPGTSLDETIAAREQAQAENLKAALDADPSMRVIVHVGFGHLNEASGSRTMFAARLKQMTGIDPLTIDQVDGTRLAGAQFDSPLYRAFVATFGEPAASVVLESDPQRPRGFYSVDLSLIHPPRREVAGRPDWLAMDGYRKPRAVALAPLGARSLVRAFVAGEPAGAIAMDQMLVPAGAQAVTLMLPAGDYRLVRQTEAGDDLPLGEARVP